MKTTFPVLGLTPGARATAAIVLSCVAAILIPVACTPARADPTSSSGRSDMRIAYKARLEAEDAAAARHQRREMSPECSDGERLWARDVGISFCAALCRDDADCDGADRCAGLDFGPPVDGTTVQFENMEMLNGENALGMCDPLWRSNPGVLAPSDEEPHGPRDLAR